MVFNQIQHNQIVVYHFQIYTASSPGISNFFFCVGFECFTCHSNSIGFCVCVCVCIKMQIHRRNLIKNFVVICSVPHIVSAVVSLVVKQHINQNITWKSLIRSYEVLVSSQIKCIYKYTWTIHWMLPVEMLQILVQITFASKNSLDKSEMSKGRMRRMRRKGKSEQQQAKRTKITWTKADYILDRINYFPFSSVAMQTKHFQLKWWENVAR